MKQSIMDMSTDILKERINGAYKILADEYKGTRPYRQVPVSPKERILKFSQFTPDMIQQARLAMGDEVVDNYLAEIAKLIGRNRSA